jgi:hypothetical protein
MIGGLDGFGERSDGDDHALMGCVLIVLEHTMRSSLLWPEKCTTWGRNLVIPSSKSAAVAAGRTSTCL